MGATTLQAPRGHVLLFGARRRIYFAERLRTRAHAAGVRVLGCDTDELDPLRFHVDGFFVLPPVGVPGFLEALVDAAREHGIGSLLPWNDGDIRWLNERRDQLAARGLRLLLPPADVVELFCDKRRTGRWAREHGLHQPDAVDPEDPRTPLVIKPRFGQGSVGVQRIDDAAQLAALPHALDPEEWIVQAWVEGTEYTVDVALAGSGGPLFIAPRRRIKTRGGEALIARLELVPAVLRYVSALCEHLDFHGVFNVQVFLQGDEVTLVELNPRFGGGTDLSIEAGADVPAYVLEMHLHGEIRSAPPTLRDGLTMTRYFAAEFFGPSEP